MEKQDLKTREPEAVLVIRDDDEYETTITEKVKDKDSGKMKTVQKKVMKKKLDLLFDEKYLSIFQSLRNGPYTIEDVTEKYNENKKKEDVKKKITIYSYVKELEKAGLVIQVGKRLTQKESGKIVTDTLYNRAAKMFYPIIVSEDFWLQEKNTELVERLAELISVYLKKPKIPVEAMKNLLSRIYTVTETEIAGFLQNESDKVTDVIGDLFFKEMDNIFRALDFIIILLNPTYYEKELKEIL